jgi:Glycosyl transferase family 2
VTARRPATPVVVFAHRRLDHLRRCVDSLRANAEAADTDVTFFCDAARDIKDQAGVTAVRDYAQTVDDFRSVRCVLRDANLGLAGSVIDGVTQSLAQHESVIVLEDDLVVSPYFLRYMNEALQLYADEPRVASVHGYVHPVDEALPETFFLRGADCWGWATWRRAWSAFEPDGRKLLIDLKRRRLTREFDFGHRYPFTGMLEDQIAARNSSWAILWHASCYLRDWLTLYPGRSLVQNIGNDGSGTHGECSELFSRAATSAPIDVHPIALEQNADAYAAFSRFHARNRGWTQHLRYRFSRGLKELV